MRLFPLGLVLLAGCTGSTDESLALRIKIVNGATGLEVRVVVDGPRFDAQTYTVPAGGTQNVSPRGDDGDIISFQVTVPSNSSITGSGDCTAGPDMSPGSTTGTYGQINLILAGAAITVECSGAGLPGGGWR